MTHGRKIEWREVDHSKMTYPSDRVTFGTLRRQEPYLFDPSKSITEDVVSIISIFESEQELATYYFNRALGTGNAESLGLSFPSCKRRLADLYLRYGIAKDAVEADDLIEMIKRNARSHAESLTNALTSGRTR